MFTELTFLTSSKHYKQARTFFSCKDPVIVNQSISVKDHRKRTCSGGEVGFIMAAEGDKAEEPGDLRGGLNLPKIPGLFSTMAFNNADVLLPRLVPNSSLGSFNSLKSKIKRKHKKCKPAIKWHRPPTDGILKI